MANDWRALADKFAGTRSSGSSNSSTSTNIKSSPAGYSGAIQNVSNNWRDLADELSGSRKQTYSGYSNNAANRVITRADKKKEEEEKKKKRKWFEKGLFEDGYDFGDVTRTILGTATDTIENLGSGIIGMGEKAVDALAYIAPFAENAQFYQNGGGYNPELQKQHEKVVEQSKKDIGKFIAKDLYDEEKVARAIISDPARKIGIDSEAHSVFGEKSDALVQSGGQLLATAGLAAAGMPWWLTTGATSFGSEAENAMNQGASYEAAGASAAISAGAEILSEKLSGGISFGGKTLDDVLTKQLARGISNKLGRTAAKLGLDVAGEGAEEVFSQVASNLGSALYKEEDITELLFSEEAMDGYLESFIGGAVMGGVAGGYNAIKSNSKGVDYVSELTQNEQKVVDKLYKDEVASREKEGKITQREKTKIYDSILEDMEKGYISIETIEEVLGGESYSAYRNAVDSEDAILKEYDELGQKTNATLKDQARYSELTQQVKDINSNSQRNALREKLSDDVMGLVKGDRLAESYNERARTGQRFEADISKYDAKQQAVVQKAIDSGILNNSNRTHEFVDFVSKISADTGVSFDFANTQKLREAGYVMEGQTIDGFYNPKEGGITVNIDSPKSRQFVVGHEITHALEGSELYDALRKSVFDYAKMKNQYDSRMESIQKRYKEGTDFEAELTADLVGEYIFSDTDFINNLSTQNRNVFQKVFDEIKYLCKVATAGSKEARELEKVKRAFEKAYREAGAQKNTADGGVKYALSKDVDGNVFVDVTEDIFDTNDGESIARTIQRVIAERFHNLIDVHGQKIQINKTTNDEFRRSNSANGVLAGSEQAYKDKLRTIANADEILSSARNWIGEATKHHRKDDIVEFARADVMYRVGENGYVADVLVGTRKNGAAVLYDLVNIYEKEITEAPVTMASDSHSQRRQDASAKKMLPQKGENVKYSLSDSDGKQLSKGQQEFFKDSQARNDEGNLVRVYHTSPTAGFTVFEGSKGDGNYKFDQYGGGVTYFTDNKEMSSSYALSDKTVDTKKLSTFEDAKKWLNDIGGSYVEIRKSGSGYKVVYSDSDAEILSYQSENDLLRNLKKDLNAEIIGRRIHGQYEGYTNIKNPYVVDAEGAVWRDINLKKEEKHSLQDFRGRIETLSSEEKAYLESKYKEALQGEEHSNRTAFEHFSESVDFLRYLHESNQGTSNGVNIWDKLFSDEETEHHGYQTKYLFDVIQNNFSTDGISAEYTIPRYERKSTNDIVEMVLNKNAQEGGTYDGVIIKNVVDYGGNIDSKFKTGENYKSLKPGDLYVVFNSNQFKAVDNLNPTNDPDIRYSLSDSDGNQLTKEQQEYFKDSKARDENGNLIKVYHSSPTAGFTVFDGAEGKGNYKYGEYGDGITFFTDNKAMADSYSPSSEKVDTAKLNNLSEAQEWLDSIGAIHLEMRKTDGEYEVYDTDEEEVIRAYDSEDELLRDLKRAVQEEYGDVNAGGQYEGYVNLKNPLVVDAEGRPWNRVTDEFSQDVFDKFQSLTEEEKAVLIDLAEWEDFSLFRKEISDGADLYEMGRENDHNRIMASIAEKMYDTEPFVDPYQLFDVAADAFSEETVKEKSTIQLSTNDYVERALQDGSYDGVIIRNVIDYGGHAHSTLSSPPGNDYIVFNSKQFKAADNLKPTDDADIRFSLSNAETDKNYLNAVNSGDTETARKIMEQVAKRRGYTIHAYHGTARGDRVGNVFLPERATSGPMAFFTDSKEIAENYSKSKQDTSMAYDPDYDRYETQFRIKVLDRDIPLYRAWGYLPFDARRRITQKAGQLRENWDGDNELILDPDTNEANGGFQWQLKEARGNAIQALTEQWLNSGNLFNEEARFLDVLEMAGVTEEFKKVKGMGELYFKDPNAKHEKVYDTFLRIRKPFDTATVDEQFISDLESWYEEQDESKYVRQNMQSDMWDKNGIDAYDFAERLRSDIENNTTHAWTSIPDSVTDYLKHLGYDGIKDTGGKFSGDSHTVWIPFASSQIKSAETVTYDDAGNVIPITERFDRKDVDIRHSLSNVGEQHTPDSLSALRYDAPVSQTNIAPTAEESTDIAPVKESLTTDPNALTTGVGKVEAPVTADDLSAVFPNDAAPVQAELEQLVSERDQLYKALEIAVDRGSAAEVGKLAEEHQALSDRIKALESEETARTGSLTDADVPAEMDAPYQPSDEYYEGVAETVDDPFEQRDIAEVGKRSVNAYQYENPEVKPFFQEAALGMLYDVRNTTKGEKWYNDELYYATGGEQGFGGTKRSTTDDIAELKDVYGYTYDQIEAGLNAIIEDDGAENNAVSKRIEFMLNDRLLNGYRDIDGRPYEPNQGYIQLLNEKQITEYSKEAFDQFMANADQYAPSLEESYAPILNSDPRYEQIAPVYDLPGGQQTYAPTKATYDATPTDDIAPLFDATGKKGVADGQQAFMPNAGEDVKQTRKEYHQSIIDNIKSIFKGRGFDFDKVLKDAKNLSTWSTVDNTPQRVMEKALGYKQGGILADITVNKVAQNETEGIKWLNAYVDQLKQISKQYGIKPGSKESAAAQMYAEGFYVKGTGKEGEYIKGKSEIVSYGDAELAIDFPNPKVRANIKMLARDPRIRKIYDDTLANINESRTRNLYPEIPRLDNYFLHFRAMEDTFSALGLPFNPNDIKAKDLPTDLNGMTADLKPGQPYFASAMHREGKRTSFDLLGGVERYLNSAKNQIYHIDDIQTLRALRNYIADSYGQAKGLENLDELSQDAQWEQIKKVYNSHLSTFAKFLNEEANVLAGKTTLIDRGVEGIFGRRGITYLNALNKQVESNMVGYNISSSLTNFLPVAQTFAKTNKFDFTKAFAQTVANKISGGRFDNFAENSPVVIRRKGEDRFYRTPWQKMADPGYALMGMVDDISTEIIARTKYNEFTRKGMDSQKAHFETDKWVSKLMGDRSLGQQPQLYNSKMLGLFTKFQLEVRNQLDAQFYDTIQETKVSNEHIKNGLARNAKTAAKVTSVFAQLAVAQHLYGMAFESMAGYNPAFDIIEVLMTAFGYDDEDDSEDTLKDNLGQGFEALMEDIPYASIITGGGRIPISSALPIKEFFKGEDQYGNEKNRWETLGEVAPYYLMPGGYGQFKKTTQGLKMFSDDHPIAGSYTDAGNLRYDVEDTVGSRIKAGIFGQYASENAQKYFDQEQRTLNPEQTEIFAGLDIPIEEYWDYRDNLYEFYDVRDALKEAAYADGATDEDVLRYTYINNVYGNVYDMYDQQKELASGKNKTELRKLQKQMEQMLSESKYAVDSVKLSGAYGEVGSKRYNKDPDSGKWYEIKPKNADGSDNWYYQKEQEVTKGLGIGYEEYWNNREEYNYAYDKPGRYAIAQALGGYDSYMEHYDALENWQSDNYIAADKDAQGNSISGSRKNKVIDYINGLDLDYGERIILYRTVYSSKTDKRTYNQQIIDYLNERDDISYQEMKSILEELEMEVDSKGNITW